MTREDALKQCKYFKGEADCPFDEQSLEHTAWCFEGLWVDAEEKNSPVLKRAEDDYKLFGLTDYRASDKTPLSLRSFLANRFFYHRNREDVDEFKKFYEALY